MAITFKDLQAANAAIKTTNIKGKEYADVAQRIKAFRTVYPTGTIATELLSNIDGVCIFKATVGYAEEDGTGSVLGVGHACEKEASSHINETSYIENCETSAVGRALGMAGFGIDSAVASAEEVTNAINNQSSGAKVPLTNKKATPKQIAYIGRICTPDELEDLKARYGTLEELPMSAASEIIESKRR